MPTRIIFLMLLHYQTTLHFFMWRVSCLSTSFDFKKPTYFCTFATYVTFFYVCMCHSIYFSWFFLVWMNEEVYIFLNFVHVHSILQMHASQVKLVYLVFLLHTKRNTLAFFSLSAFHVLFYFYYNLYLIFIYLSFNQVHCQKLFLFCCVTTTMMLTHYVLWYLTIFGKSINSWHISTSTVPHSMPPYQLNTFYRYTNRHDKTSECVCVHRHEFNRLFVPYVSQLDCMSTRPAKIH